MKTHIKTHPIKPTPNPSKEGSSAGNGHAQYALHADLRPDPKQPRKEFPASSLSELVTNLAANGIQEALTVRADPERKTKWLIVDGERRWRAAGLLGLKRLPIVVREYADDAAVRSYQRIVGTQRLNLSALEEAASLAADLKARQQADPQFSPTKLGEVLGLSRATVYERLSLLKLPTHVMEALRAGQLNASQAVRIGTVQNPASQKRLVEEVRTANERSEPVSVRQLATQIASTAVKRPVNPAGSLPQAKLLQAKKKLLETLAVIGEKALATLKQRALKQPMPPGVWDMMSGNLTRGILNERGDDFGDTFANVCKHYGVDLGKMLKSGNAEKLKPAKPPGIKTAKKGKKK